MWRKALIVTLVLFFISTILGVSSRLGIRAIVDNNPEWILEQGWTTGDFFQIVVSIASALTFMLQFLIIWWALRSVQFTPEYTEKPKNKVKREPQY